MFPSTVNTNSYYKIFINKFIPCSVQTQIWSNLIEYKQVSKSYEIFLSELKCSSFSKKDRVISTLLLQQKNRMVSFDIIMWSQIIIYRFKKCFNFNLVAKTLTLNLQFAIKTWVNDVQYRVNILHWSDKEMRLYANSFCK